MASTGPFSRARTRSLSTRLLGAGLLAAVCAVPTQATLTNSGQALERIGKGATDPVAILPIAAYSNAGRVLVAQRNGELRLLAGDGLVSDLLTTITVSQTCAGEGLLGAAWHPANLGQLYVSYVDAATRKITIDKIQINPDFTVGAPQRVYQVNLATTCQNLGGALGWTLDNKLLVGTGDFGNSALASQVTSPAGKILRLNDDGTLPSGNALPGSPVFSLGVRNPVAFGRDVLVTFIDSAPGVNDELNILGTFPATYGWPTGTGALGQPSFTDPVYTWAGGPGILAMATYRPTGGNGLGSGYEGDLIVATASGNIDRIDTNNGNPPFTRQPLYTPDPGPPVSWVGAGLLEDGFVYLLHSTGDLWRFRSNTGSPSEPSARLSIVPMMVTKAPGGMIQISAERQMAAIEYGLYIGDVMGMDAALDGNGDGTPDGLNHPELATQYLPVDGNVSDAYTRFQVPGSFVGPAAYMLMSAESPRLETGLGANSIGLVRYGGNQQFGCPCTAQPEGTVPGTCAEPFTLARGLQGTGVEIGPNSFPSDYECGVIVLDLSAEWCTFCRRGTPHFEELYDLYKDRGLVIVQVISEDNGGANADFPTIERWQRMFNADPRVGPDGLTFPVLLDEGHRVYDQWFVGPGCGGIPQIFVFGRDGVMTDFICGDNAAAIDAAVTREINR